MYIIRPAKIKDLPEVDKMSFELGKYEERIDGYFTMGKNYKSYYNDFFRKSINIKGRMLLVAQSGDKIIGFGYGRINERLEYKMKKYGFIRDIYVEKNFRRQGVAGEILKALYQWFKKNKIYNIELNVLVKNKIGIRAWEKYGFKDSFIGKRKIIK